MRKSKKSGPALFMYAVIAVTAAAAALCLGMHYGGIFGNNVVLWIGITSFTIMYHLWLRIIMGNVTKLFGINHRQRWFREYGFEKRLYKVLRVKKWKDKVLTYNPELFSLEDYTLEAVADTMSKAEIDHWINELISLSTLLFSIVWGAFPIFLATAVCAMVFDAQFIIIQRYNRPRIVKLLKKKQGKKDEAVFCTA